MVDECCKYIQAELWELGPYVTYSKKGESYTVKFKEPKLGSLRITCLEVDAQFSFRWNLITGDAEEVKTKYKSHWYYIQDVKDFVRRIERYAATVAANSDNKLATPGGYLVSEPKHLADVPPVTEYEDQYDWVHEVGVNNSVGDE